MLLVKFSPACDFLGVSENNFLPKSSLSDLLGVDWGVFSSDEGDEPTLRLLLLRNDLCSELDESREDTLKLGDRGEDTGQQESMKLL